MGKSMFHMSTALSSLTVMLVTVAYAPKAAATQDAAYAVEEIVVTAQKRAQSMQEVPVAVNALSEERLRETGIRTLEDLAAITPGLVTTNNIGNGSAPLTIRGVGGANGGGNIFADEPVAIYVNDVYVGRPRIAAADLVDMASVQVLRGPQGTLFGRNATAGALLLTTAAPTDDFEAVLNGMVANHAEYRFSGAVSGSMNKAKTIMARLAFGHTNRNGWARNSHNGERIGGSETTTARLSLRLLPTDGITIDLIGEYSDATDRPATLAISDVSHLRDENTNPAGDNIVFPYTQRSDLQQLIDNDVFAHNVPFEGSTEGKSFVGKIEWDLGGVVLNSITGWRQWLASGTQDSDGTAIDPPTPLFVSGDVATIGDNLGSFKDNEWSQELRLTSKGDNRFNWIAGLYYYHAYNELKPIIINNGLAGPGGSGTKVEFNAWQTTDSYSVFVDASYDLTDALTLTVGGRYSDDKKKFVNSNSVTTLNSFDPPGPVVFPAGFTLFTGSVDFEKSWQDFSPRAVLDYKITDDVMVYTSFSKAFKSGGFNAFGLVDSFAPENITAYEVGLKSDLANGKARLNMAAYHYDYSDLQVRTPVPTGGVGIETAEKARVTGFEVEATLMPVEGLRFDANLAYADAHFVSGTLSSINVDSFVLGTTVATDLEDIAGNRMTRAPKWQSSVGASYIIPVSDRFELKLQALNRYQSGVYFLETRQDADTFYTGGWNEIDARISLISADDWSVAFFGKNLTNNRHFTQVTAFFALPNGTLNEPRRFGVQFNAHF